MSKSIFFGLIICFLSTSLMSHQRSESYSRLEIISKDNSKYIDIEFSIQTTVLQRLGFSFNGNWEEILEKEVISNFTLRNECTSLRVPFLKKSLSTGYLTLLWEMKCPGDELELGFNLFFENDPTHAHIATFLIEEKAIPEKVFSNSDRVWKETDKQTQDISVFNSFYDYVNLGFKHILSGYDHLAFLMALLLLNLSIRRLILMITGFTIGHSLTLALGALGLVSPSSQFIEALIGYSIIIIALEATAKITKNHKIYARSLVFLSSGFILFMALFGHQKFLIGIIGISIFSYCYLSLLSRHGEFSITLVITCFFGLIHGFGFAGNLSSLGLMEDRILPAILGFNIGVELGQILLVFVAFFLLRQIENVMKENTNLIRIYAASGLSSLGMFWFLQRLF